MVKGFYNLTSGMLTQRRKLDVISSNMANVSTAGFKADQLSSSTFDDAIMARTGNENKANPEELGNTTMARIPRETITNFEAGGYRQTESSLDFAIEGDGFFQVRNGNNLRYTRSGSFNLNDQGYICTQEGDLVMGMNGPIQVFNPEEENVQQFNAEKIQVDNSGNVFDSLGNFVDRFNIVDFDDTAQLVKQDIYFTGGGQPRQVDVTVKQKMLENSNVNALKEMVTMIESERYLQSSAQILKMYDNMLSTANTDIGRIQ